MTEEHDTRTWAPTDLPGESISIGRPWTGIEILSARGSERNWSEPLHEMFTVAAVQPGPVPTAAEWQTRGHTVTTAAGQLMTINAGDGHKTSRVHAPSAFDAVKISPSWIHEASAQLGTRPFVFRSASEANAPVFRAVQRLVGALAEGAPPFAVELACHDLVHTVVTELAETPPEVLRQAHGSYRDSRARRIRDYLFEQRSGRPTMNDMTAEAGLGKTQLCARFKAQYGVSPGDYWEACQMLRAKALLVDERRPAKYVAAELGYADESHFSRTFRRHHGLPPAAWSSLFQKNSRVRTPRS